MALAESTTPGLRAFDGIERGDRAPEWVHDGIVRAWGVTGAIAVTLIVLSENVTFKVVVDSLPTMVVRLGRPGYAESTRHVRSELLWAVALKAEVGIPTPAPVRGADGDLVQTVREADGSEWTAVAFDFVVGSVLEDTAEVTPHFTEIGQLTALLHTHARSWPTPATFARFTWDLPDLVGPTARWGDWRDADLDPSQQSVLERAETAALSTLDELGIDRLPKHFGLIHGDLRPSNVMVPASGRDSLVIIDFNDCGYGYYLYDFAASLTFYEHRPQAQEMAAGWLAGYARHHPLASADLRAAAALSLVRRLTMLGWATTHRADALPPDLWDENLPGTVEVAARYLRDPSWITSG